MPNNMSRPAASRGLIAFTVMLPTLIEIIDTSIVNVSLNHIRGSLSAGIDESTWTITAYLVSNAVIIPMAGWLSRLIGRKNYLIASITPFTVSSFIFGFGREPPKPHLFQDRAGHRRRRPRADQPVHPARKFPPGKARHGHGHLRHGRHAGPHP